MLRHFQAYIDGQFVDGAEKFDSINPASGEVWATMPAASAGDVDQAVRAANRALADPAWCDLTATQRGKLLYRLADLVAENAGALAEIETRDTGKIIRETTAQISYIAEYYRYFAGLADKIEGAHINVDKADIDVYLRREPIGVVAAIVSWNSQLFLSAMKLGPALAAGCTVVVKASEDGPACLLEFARLVHAAGFPPGVVSIVTGFGDTCGRALTSHPLVNRIAFTGGSSTARKIVQNSANNLAYTTLELGGKSPVLVFADADLDNAANAIVSGIFAASGQSCVAGSRLLVERRVHDQLVEVLQRKTRHIRIGDPLSSETDMGPLATLRQLKHIEDVVARSVEAGAIVAAGGRRPEGSPRGFYYQPTIICCNGNSLPCAAEELFGPVLSVIAFDDERDALGKANDSPYGLASGVFTKDLARAHRLIKRIRAGIVWVNTYRVISPLVPFGGFGLSGLGREGGSQAVLDYTRTKSVWIRTSDEPMADPFVMR